MPSHPRPTERLGLQLGEWSISCVLGEGGMGCVYEAHNAAGETAAIKILRPEHARDTQMVDRFLREAEILERIAGHPASLDFFGGGETPDGLPFMTLERLRGQELAELWKARGKRLEVEEALGLLDPVLDLLAICHRQGIVHRDLKPANIFVCEGGGAKVLDFGIARVRQAGAEQTRAGLAIGTAAYMAPEQAIGRSDLTDGRADIFAAGAILYLLLSGARLRSGSSFEDVFVQAATTAPSSLARVAPHLPLELIHVVDKALAWDPRDRYQTAEELQDALRSFLSHGDRRVSQVPAGLGGTLPLPLPELRAHAEGGGAVVEQAEALLLLRDVAQGIERTLQTARQYQWEHGETRRRLEALAKIVEEGLRGYPESLQWSVTPSAFMVGEDVVWAPDPPLNGVPYNLFAAGVHHLQLTPGLSQDELERFLRFLMLDPAADLAAEDDLSVRLWELGLERVRYQLVSGFQFSERDDPAAGVPSCDRSEEAALEDERQELLGMLALAGRPAMAEARSMGLGIDPIGSAPQPAELYGAFPVVPSAALVQRLASPGHGVEQIAEVLARSLREAERGGDLHRLGGRLGELVRGYVRDEHTPEFLALFAAVLSHLEPGSAARSLFVQASVERDGLALLLHAVGALTRTTDFDPVPGLLPLLAELGPDAAQPVLALAPRTAGPLYEALLEWIFSRVSGAEPAIGAALVNAGLEHGSALIRALAAAGTPAAGAALRSAEDNPELELRLRGLEALIQGWPGEAGRAAPYLTHEDPRIRIRVLRALAGATVTSLVPPLIARITSAGFASLPHIERRLLLETLWSVDPLRAEQALVELLAAGASLVSAPELASTRMLALQLLAQRGRTPSAIAAIEQLLDVRRGCGPELRKQAALAADQIRRRVQEWRA